MIPRSLAIDILAVSLAAVALASIVSSRADASASHRDDARGREPPSEPRQPTEQAPVIALADDDPPSAADSSSSDASPRGSSLHEEVPSDDGPAGRQATEGRSAEGHRPGGSPGPDGSPEPDGSPLTDQHPDGRTGGRHPVVEQPPDGQAAEDQAAEDQSSDDGAAKTSSRARAKKPRGTPQPPPEECPNLERLTRKKGASWDTYTSQKQCYLAQRDWNNLTVALYLADEKGLSDEKTVLCKSLRRTATGGKVSQAKDTENSTEREVKDLCRW